MPKFREYFNQMFAQNRELFLQFKLLSDDYAKDKGKYKAAFDSQGTKVVAIIKEWEQRLCGHMEKGSNAQFSSRLADKFWDEVRAYFPNIDEVGLVVRKVKV